jgi:hypothetical protein
LSIFQKLFRNVVLSVAEYPTKPVLVLSKVKTSQNFGRITKKTDILKNVRPNLIFFFIFSFSGRKPKIFNFRMAEVMPQWPIFPTKLAENFCLEFATLGDASVRADLINKFAHFGG